MEIAKVYMLHIHSTKGGETQLVSLLPSCRVDKARRFVREKDRLLSLAAGYLVRRYVGDSHTDAYGKPRANGILFSLSHSGEYAAMAVAPYEVGLDIEIARQDQDFDAMATCCFAQDELAAYRNGTPFLALFTAKESLAKAEGKGLGDNIQDIPALPLEGEVTYQNKTYYRHATMYNGYHLSIAMEQKDFAIQTEEVYVD